jgi:hypothetical protein
MLRVLAMWDLGKSIAVRHQMSGECLGEAYFSLKTTSSRWLAIVFIRREGSEPLEMQDADMTTSEMYRYQI